MPKPSSNNFARKIRSYGILVATAIIVVWKFGNRFKESYFPEPTTTVSSSSKIRHIGNYEVMEGCEWIDDRGNDGDSFLVKFGKSEHHIRLYFVDTPEKYLSDEHKNQRDRVAQQGKYFGGLSPDQAVEIGLKAKAFTKKQLKGKPFTVVTKWENVYGGDRYYAFVWLSGSTEDNPVRLSDELVKNGLARIHTKGPVSGDASGFSQIDDERQWSKSLSKRLLELENQAKQAGAGAWGVK